MVQNTFIRRNSNADKTKRKLRKKNEENLAENVKRRMVEIGGKTPHRNENNVRRQKTTKPMGNERKTRKNNGNTEVKRRSNKILDPIAENILIREKNRRISEKNRRLSEKKESKRRKMRKSATADDVKVETDKTLPKDSTTFPTIKPILVIKRNHKKSIKDTTVLPKTTSIVSKSKPKAVHQPKPLYKRSVKP